MTSELEIRTKIFSPQKEGDEEYCNAKPGSELAAWIRNRLEKRGYSCAEIIQEDYGWGFYITEQNLDIWIGVGLMDEQDENAQHWGISAAHDAPFKPSQWLKKREGKIAAEKVLSDIKIEIESEPDFSLVKN